MRISDWSSDVCSSDLVRLRIYRFGHAGIPETRPHIEAFFKSIEVQVLRYLAGGFEPETKMREEQRVSARNSKTHPIFLHLLEDMLDIVFSTYNVTPHEGLQGRSPREVIRSEEHTSELQSLMRISYAVFC